MTALSDLIIERVGRENISKNSALGRMVQRRGVSATSEFRRVLALPRREWDNATLPELTERLTRFVKTDQGAMGLWPIQAAALRDLHDCRGAFLPIGVGRGKALISLLAPVVLGAQRPVLFVPADLREQTNRKVLPEMSRHWRLHPGLRVIGYSELSLAKNATMLEDLEPDLIVLDECHSVKNKTAGRTRRLVRYMKARPGTMVVAMSGTVSNRSIKDYWHIIHWCLKDLMTPLPLTYREMEDWALAVDEKVPDEQRVNPGALMQFAAKGTPVTVDEGRKAYRNRLTATPGVVATGEAVLGTSLRIYRRHPTLPGEVWRALSILETQWKTPNGDYVAEAVDLWRHARELALGFYYKWKYPAPPEWLDARKEWKRFVRETLKGSQTMDTELQVWNACQSGELDQADWLSWVEVKDKFKPETEPYWMDDFAVEDCLRWSKQHGGIVWVEHVAFGERLGERGLRYYGAGARDSAAILDATGPIAASIRSHGQGKNLHQWCKNLVTAPPASGKTWEQMLGRTHRVGQEADEVMFEVYQHASGLVGSFEQAQADARYLEQTLGSHQKLNYADIVTETRRYGDA